MKGDSSVIAALNGTLTSELTSTDFYWLHWRSLKIRGYRELGHAFRDHAKVEQEHTKDLLAQIFFLEGTPEIKHDPVVLKRDFTAMFDQGLKLETSSRTKYEKAIKVCRDAEDQGTLFMLTKMLREEESQILWFEQQQSTLKEMGAQNYFQHFAGN